MSHEELAGIMLSLQREGWHNINLVSSPSHQVAAIARSIMIAAGKGLSLPIVYNCGGYESLETLRALEGMIDIYMPDMKYADGDVAERYSHAGDYPEVSQRAVMEMHRQVGDLTVNLYGIALRGLLVRHLVLPQGLAGTDLIVNFIATEVLTNDRLNREKPQRPPATLSRLASLRLGNMKKTTKLLLTFPVKRLLLFGQLLLLLFLSAPEVTARPNIRLAFFTFYTNAVGSRLDSVPSKAGHCGVCHYDFNGGGTRNAYGAALEIYAATNGCLLTQGACRDNAIRAMRSVDVDADGYTTDTEVTNT